MKTKNSLSKRILFALVLIFLAGGAIFLVYSQSSKLGDVNGNGTVDIVDALLIAQFSAGLPLTQFDGNVADTNCDAQVNIIDALLVARFSAGLSSVFCSATPVVTPTPTRTPNPTCSLCTLTITGRVVDSTSFTGLGKVNVIVYSVNQYGENAYSFAVTNSDGTYTLSLQVCRSTDSVRITAASTGYQNWVLDTRLTCNVVNKLDINLVYGYSAAPIRGHLINAKSTLLATAISAVGDRTMVQRTINAPMYVDDSQIWTFNSETTGYYSITGGGGLLTVENASLQAGAYVIAGSRIGTYPEDHQQ